MNLAPRLLWVVAFFLPLATFSANAEEAFPGRKLYPDVPVMERAALEKRFEQVLIIDVRSEYEYQTLHIKGAHLVPLSSENFGTKLAALRMEHGAKPLVFYCNGHSCEKSYQAVRKARFTKLGDLFAYDAGIFDWAKNNPAQAELLGQPVDTNKLISDEQFKAHLLDPNTFTQQATTSNSIILDIRDRFQREGLSLFGGKEKSVPLDNDKMRAYIEQAKRDNKTLYIYDAAGHQVKWLQYFLEANDLKNYFFLKGGVKDFYDVLRANTGFKTKTP